MRRSALMLMLLVANVVKLSAKEFVIGTVEELNEIQGKAHPGDVITIKDGIYSGWKAEVKVSGTAAAPIMIRAQHAGKVVFTGDVTDVVFEVKGSFILLKDLSFKDCVLSKANGKTGLLINLNSTESSRITACVFDNNSVKQQFMALVRISGNGKNNIVDRCSFSKNKDNQDLQVSVSKESCPQNTIIRNNLFRDKEPVSWKNNNGGECVQIGQDPVLLGTIKANTLVRDNTFIKCNGEPEVISNKSSGNSYISNRFENCEGELVMRGREIAFKICVE